MARINKTQLTRLEIIQVASRRFLEQGYSSTTISAICKELEMSTGNLTFHYPTKEHLLAELVEMLCDFQWELMRKEVDGGRSSLMAICLELMAMAAICEESSIAKDFYISAYTSPMALEIIRREDTIKSRRVFGEYCADWTDEQFAAAETLVSGIEYATLMTTADSAPIDISIADSLDHIMKIYNVPEQKRLSKVEMVLSMDYRGIGRKVLAEFKEYVQKTNYNALEELLHAHSC